MLARWISSLSVFSHVYLPSWIECQMYLSHILSPQSPGLFWSQSAPVHSLEAAKVGRKIKKCNQTIDRSNSASLACTMHQDQHSPGGVGCSNQQVLCCPLHNHPLHHHAIWICDTSRSLLWFTLLATLCTHLYSNVVFRKNRFKWWSEDMQFAHQDHRKNI